jgi:hypothetical protein
MSKEIKSVEVDVAASAFDDNQFIATQTVINALRRMGVPVIGPVGIISVETGTLTISMVDDDEPYYVYRWVGVPLAPHLRKNCYTLEKSLADAIAQENDL